MLNRFLCHFHTDFEPHYPLDTTSCREQFHSLTPQLATFRIFWTCHWLNPASISWSFPGKVQYFGISFLLHKTIMSCPIFLVSDLKNAGMSVYSFHRSGSVPLSISLWKFPASTEFTMKSELKILSFYPLIIQVFFHKPGYNSQGSGFHFVIVQLGLHTALHQIHESLPHS